MKYTRITNGNEEIFEGTVEDINRLIMLLPEELLSEELFLGNLGEGIDVGTDNNIIRGTVEI